MKQTYCTIITSDYLHYALSLNASLLKFDNTIQFKILITDKNFTESIIENQYTNIEIFTTNQVCKEGVAQKILDRYFNISMDCFRWSMKPVFLNFLIKQGFEQVFFLDPDLFFFSEHAFLSNELEGNSVLLTPHWRASNPEADSDNFNILLTSGLFNAGFVGVSKTGVEAMEWWANACAYCCQKKPSQGFFNDQAYLNLLPIYFNKIKIIEHRGCNVANWNQVECKRISKDNKVIINNKYDIVFIHFTQSTIKGIQSGGDYLLKPYLENYIKSLEKFQIEIKSLFQNRNYGYKIEKSKNLIHSKTNEANFYTLEFSYKKLDSFLTRDFTHDTMLDALNSFEGTLLDVGCAQMHYKTLFTSPPYRVTRYIGLDFENNPTYEYHSDITWQNGRIPLEDKTVNCVICTEILKNFPEPESLLKEIKRVLKPRGFLFLTVPFFWPMQNWSHREYRFTPFSLQQQLVNSGFTDIDISPKGGWDGSLAQMMGLWVRRRPMKRWLKFLLSYSLMPLMHLLIIKDRSSKIKLTENIMISCMSVTARKVGPSS